MRFSMSPCPGARGSPARSRSTSDSSPTRGWELSLDSRALERPRFSLDLGLGISGNQNRIDDLAGRPETNTIREGLELPRSRSRRQALTAEFDADGTGRQPDV
jgi:hypothetical protein